MAKKSKSEITIEKLDDYILKNYNHISNVELNNGIKSILKECRDLKNITPSLIFIFTIFRYKDLDFFKKFKTCDNIKKYFQNILSDYCITSRTAGISLPREIVEKIERYYYEVNPRVKEFDKLLIFYHRNKFIDDEDVQMLVKIKENKINDIILNDTEIINKSIFLNKILTSIQFKDE